MAEPPPGHVRMAGSGETKRNWLNQLVVVAECSGASKKRPCVWEKAASVWEHVTSPLPYSDFPGR